MSTHEEGNYTCKVENVNMMQLKINVIPKARLLTQGEISLNDNALITSEAQEGSIFQLI